MRLFVGLQTGVHTMASALYDANGAMLWMDEKEGPYPRSAAVAELAGSGQPTIVVDNHGKHLLYSIDGKSRLIAHGWNSTVPGRSDGTKYALPIVGPFGTNGDICIVMSPGLDALETLNLAGERMAKRAFGSAYEFDWCGSALGKIRRDGEWDIVMVTQEGILHCVDVHTCQTRWTLDLGTKATSPINVVSGDLDGDGRDNFLVGLPNGDLLALDEHNGAGLILWKVSLDAGVREAILADVDGDGLLEIIVETEDGRVRVLKGSD
jgi:outer membrane protein assembly factor BamB